MKLIKVTVFAASIFAAGLTIAEDRFSLTSPNGISFSEFKDYESWAVIGSSMPDDAGGCGSSPEPGCIKSILGNAAMIRAYQEGIPTNGEAVPDGAAMAKVEWQKAREVTPYAVTVPGTFMEVAFMVKDSKRFPATDGWGYATFKYDVTSNTFRTFGETAAFANACHGCHTIVKGNDFVFTTYPKR